jgi:putative nucleotidyltransferase with HDIG domain
MKANIKLPAEIEDICKKITDAGFEAVLVGGVVRDLLGKKQAKDWDLTTSATPAQILKLFKNAFYNNQFGTVGIVTKNQNIVEITTYRTESSYKDSRHPEKVAWGKSLEEDLARRDFTINSIAIRYPTLEIVDLYKGQKDLEKKLIRAVGDPDERFGEDALRILRAIRFATTLEFKIEPKTLAAISKNANLISKISGERVREELFKMIMSKDPEKGFFLAHEAGVLAVILPELDVCFDVPQKSPKRHHIYDVATHCIYSLKYCPSNDPLVRFATLLHDIGKAKVAKTIDGVRTFYNHEVVGARQAKEIADRLHLSREQRDKLFLLVRWHQFSVGENQTDAAIRRFIKNVGIENVNDMMDLRVGDRLGGGLQQPESWRLKLFRQRIAEVLTKPFSVTDLKINGRDVMEVLNIKPGRQVGEILNKLFESVADNKEKNDRDYLLKKLATFKKS